MRAMADIPFAPRRWPFFYGWVIVAMSIFALLASIPGQTVGVGVFNDYLMEAWGLTRTQISIAYMLGTVISSFILPLAGQLQDRIGARLMVVVAAVGLAASLVGLGWADRIAGAGLAGVTAVAIGLMTALFLALRFFGQGCLALVGRVIVGKWFDKRRGLASGIGGVIGGFGFNYSPRLLNDLITFAGWRGGYVILAGVIGIGVSAIGWLLIRDNPEECGLTMDGDTDLEEDDVAREKRARTRDYTRREAVRTWGFWAFSLALGGHGLVVTAMSFHIASFAAEHGLSREAAFDIYFPMAFFSVPTTIVGGWISDKIKLKYLLMVFLCGQLVGTIGLLNLGAPWGRWMIYGGYGTAAGLFGLLGLVAFPRFYGRAHLGAISGLNMSIMVFASAIGPFLFSQMRDLTGSYSEVTLAWCAVPLLLLLGSLKADSPQSNE
jgi:sugar phosphate permease